jgi:hypothetical protein
MTKKVYFYLVVCMMSLDIYAFKVKELSRLIVYNSIQSHSLKTCSLLVFGNVFVGGNLSVRGSIFARSLIGPTGPQGLQGPIGLEGPTGPQGPTGEPGIASNINTLNQTFVLYGVVEPENDTIVQGEGFSITVSPDQETLEVTYDNPFPVGYNPTVTVTGENLSESEVNIQAGSCTVDPPSIFGPSILVVTSSDNTGFSIQKKAISGTPDTTFAFEAGERVHFKVAGDPS